MATPMYVFNEIAARFGVNPKDDTAVDAFFESGARNLAKKTQESIMQELLLRDGETARPTKYHQSAPDSPRKRATATR